MEARMRPTLNNKFAHIPKGAQKISKRFKNKSYANIKENKSASKFKNDLNMAPHPKSREGLTSP